jgi:hypothetical protein
MGLFKNYDKFLKNIYSQNGEDGVINEILNELQISDGTCIEFGASKGKDNSNTFSLVEKGWSALYIESDKEKFVELTETTKNYPYVTLANKFVSSKKGLDDLNSIIFENNFDPNCVVLSIDIDSEDLRVWEVFKGTPSIVVIEINSSIKPGILNYHLDKYVGNSFSSTCITAKKKGYVLLCHTGNLIFLRKDLLRFSRLSKFYIYAPRLLYKRNWIEKSYIEEYLVYKYNKYIKKYLH